MQTTKTKAHKYVYFYLQVKIYIFLVLCLIVIDFASLLASHCSWLSNRKMLIVTLNRSSCTLGPSTQQVHSVIQTQAYLGQPLIIIYTLYGFFNARSCWFKDEQQHIHFELCNHSFITHITGMCVPVKSHITVYSSLVIANIQYLSQTAEYHMSGFYCIIHLLRHI